MLNTRLRRIPEDDIREGALFQCPAGDRRELARDPVGGLASDRQLALALEFLDRRLGLRIDKPGRLDLAVAELRRARAAPP